MILLGVIDILNTKLAFTYIMIFLLLFQSTLEFLLGNTIVSYIDEIFIAIVFFIALINIFKYKRISKISLNILVVIIIFVSTGFISGILNSKYVMTDLVLSSFLSCKFFLLIFSISNIKLSDVFKKYTLSAIKFFGGVCLVFALFNMLFPNIYFKLFPFAIQDYRMGFLCITSLFYHPGIYGWFMLLVSLLYFSDYVSDKNKKSLYLALLYCLFSVLCFRSKVIISIIIILFYQLIIRKKIQLKKIILVLVFGITIYLIFGELLKKTYNLYILGNSGDTTARQLLLINSFKLMSEYFPLGVGFGKYGSWYSAVNYSEIYYKMGMNTTWGLTPEKRAYITDTFWPSIMGETGILGTMVYIVFIKYIYDIILSYNKKNNDKYSYFSLMIFIQLICESLGAPSFNSAPQNIIVGLIIGIVLSTIIYNKKVKVS